jgi:hypothetical protein
MAAPSDYWDEVDMKALLAGGFVNEDVMQKIFDISRIPLPFTDAIGTDTSEQSFTEWTEDSLKAVNPSNAVVSGADATGNNASGGKRMGNHHQNSVKVVAVTERTTHTSAIGTSDEYARQLMMRQQELRQDVEAISMGRQGSIADDNNTIAGKAGGFSAWLTTNDQLGVGGSAPGFNTTTKLVEPVVAGTARALAFDAHIRNTVEAIFTSNGNPTILMSTARMIKNLNAFMFSAAGQGYAAVPTANVSGTAPTDQVQQGFINVMRTDFGTTLRIVPNRLQQMYNDSTGTPIPVCDVYLIDPMHVALTYLKGYQTKPLAKLGLSERSQISVDWSTKVYIEKAHGVIRDIDPTLAVV